MVKDLNIPDTNDLISELEDMSMVQTQVLVLNLLIGWLSLPIDLTYSLEAVENKP